MHPTTTRSERHNHMIATVDAMRGANTHNALRGARRRKKRSHQRTLSAKLKMKMYATDELNGMRDRATAKSA